MTDTDTERAPLWRRLAWFFTIAIVSAGVTAGAAYGLKALLPMP